MNKKAAPVTGDGFARQDKRHGPGWAMPLVLLMEERIARQSRI